MIQRLFLPCLCGDEGNIILTSNERPPPSERATNPPALLLHAFYEQVGCETLMKN